VHLTKEAPASTTEAPGAEDIDVQTLSPEAWRVKDVRFPEHDARALIGFIEKKDDVFEVMQLGDGFQWFTYGSLSDAVDHFVRVSPPASPRDHVLSWTPDHG
jgi:hypothetical protein